MNHAEELPVRVALRSRMNVGLSESCQGMSFKNLWHQLEEKWPCEVSGGAMPLYRNSVR